MRLASAALLLVVLAAVPQRASAMIAVDGIFRVVHAHLDAVQRCYADALANEPQLAGRLSMTITIEPSGHVSEAHVVDDGVGSPSMNLCLIAEVRTWVFPSTVPSHGPVVIHYPFHFSP